MNFKRLLKPILVILAILILTLSVSAGDLYSTYGQRIKLTIDHTEIDADLSWFPVTVFLTDSQGEEVFAEFDADEDFDRIAFTSSDGETQLYADCELFDDSEQKAIYHVSKTGWTVSSSTDTDIYLYYDDTADHNTTYISKSGGTAAQSVWDSNFKAVYHMQDDTTSTILDSTSNNNDGTKKGSGEPAEATGLVGKGQDFDDTDDYINVGNSGLDPGENDFTIETVFSRQDYNDHQRLFNKRDSTTTQWFDITLHSDNTIETSISQNYGVLGQVYQKTSTTFTTDDWNYHAASFDRDGNLQNYVNGSTDGSAADISDHSADLSPNYNAYIGSYRGMYYEMNGIIDEQRISFSLRSAAWIAATYNSLWDTLLTYGSEEAAPEEESTSNIFFLFSNF